FSGSRWAVGYTSDMVGALWMGNFKNNRIFNVTALDAVGEWGEIMRVALNSAPRPFEMPDGITTYTICPEDGTLYEDTCPSPGVTEFARKDQPPPVSGRGELLTLLIDSWTGKQANQYCPDHMLTATFLTTEDPFALQWVQSVAGQAWARRVNLTLPLQSAPTASCQPGDPVPVVRINSPQEGETIQAIASIVGTASGPDFESYQLLLAPAGSSDFVMISPEITQALPSSGSELHTWDTRMVPNGEYILRLQAVSTTGGFIYVDRTITVGNS
ncbi:MAG: hypothetical protein KC615_24725, partial [Anaerolineae bacterium]|nr:hypothetical protein [Anaerolineae bacterium]